MDDAIEYEPVAQAPVTAVKPVVEQYDPAIHAKQIEDPEDETNDAARQLVQLVDEAEEAYVPARQLEQKLAEATEYVPAAQAPVTVLSPMVAQYDPAVHIVHAVVPAIA